MTAEFDLIRRQVLDLCKDIARLSHQLHPTTLDRLGLPVALRNLCEQLTDGDRTVTFTSDGEFPRLASEVSVALYRIAQESLRNALTHSGASRIYLELTASRTHITLEIRDTGCGFDIVSVGTLGLGLSGMAERMRNAGGNLIVASRPGRGTTITPTVPIVQSMTAHH